MLYLNRKAKRLIISLRFSLRLHKNLIRRFAVMKKTVRGVVYDTDAMTVVKKVTSGAFGDPAGYEETLYVAENGSYFLYTNGGEASKYASEKLTSLSKAKAAAWEKENA